MNESSTVEFLSYLRSLDVKVYAERDQLRISAPTEILTPDLRRELTARKSEILHFVKEASWANRLRTDLLPIMPADKDERLKLSFAEQRLWFLAQLEGAREAYHITGGFHLRGELDRAALCRALDRIVVRHEVLRTTFTQIDGKPVRRIAPEEGSRFHLSEHDLRQRSDAKEELDRLMKQEASESFDLERGPLIRGRLIRQAEEEHALLITMHHIVSDGWSMGVLSNELSALYRAYRDGEADPLPRLGLQYGDYAALQRRWITGEVLQQQEKYWEATLAGAPAVLELPMDHARPAQQDYAGALVELELDAELTKALKALGRRRGATLFMTLLAGWAALLSRLSGQQDLIIGVPVANRGRSEIGGLIGFFVNTLALRLDLSGSPTVGGLLDRVKAQALAGQQHQDIPFEQVVEIARPMRSLSHSPLVQVMFAWQNTPEGTLELPGLEVEPLEKASEAHAKLDLILTLREEGERIVGDLEYATSLFERSTVERYLGHLRTLLKAMVVDDTRAMDRLPLLSEAERRCVLEKWNDTKTEYPRDKCIQELFEEQVERTPGAIAVICGEQRLTYRELNNRANRLAHYLRELGVKPDGRVAICAERGVEMVVGLLAVLKADGAYVPLDPAYPAERLSYMLEDSAPSLLLTQGRLKGMFEELSKALPVIDLTTDSPQWANQPASNPDRPSVGLTAEHLAYVMYTSGSTGRPKGVEVLHRGIVRLVVGSEFVELNEKQVFLQMAPISFDASTFEIWGALLHGAQLVIFTSSLPDVGELGDALSRHGVTTLWLTTSLFNAIVDVAPERLAQVRQLLVGGEALSVPHVIRALRALPKTNLINGYGPTESTTFACCYPIPRDLSRTSTSIPIGSPIANTRVYNLDRYLQPVPVGAVGELYIGGDGLARGYVNLPQLTRDRFIPDPFQGTGRLYKTGDLVRYLPDGNLEFLGRADQQVKIRGYRIELGEVEAVLKEQPEISQAVVIAREDTPGEKRLVAYVVTSAGTAPAASELGTRLKQGLPDYMMPAAYVFLDQLPIMANGKINRKALPAPELTADWVGKEEYAAPRTKVEQQLASIWAHLLHRQSIGIRDNFFDIGGHSLLAVQLIAKVLSAFPGSQPSLALLLKAPTVEQFASTFKGGQADSSCLVPMREGTERPPFFCLNGGGGNLLSLRDLAMAMPSDQPFYCLQDRAFDGHSAPFSSVEETADCFIEEIRRVQSHGPYYLGGWCYGGLVVFEMARRLRSMGEAVSVLALIETFNPTYACYLSKPKLLYFNSRFSLRRAVHHMKTLGRIKPREWGRYLSGRARSFLRTSIEVARQAGWGTGDQFPIDRPPVDLRTLEGLSEVDKLMNRVQNASVLAARAFVPKPYDGHLLLFTANNRYVHPYQDEAFGWRPLALGGVTTYEIDGDHTSIFHHPGVAALAMSLDRALREAQRAGRGSGTRALAPSTPPDSQTQVLAV